MRDNDDLQENMPSSAYYIACLVSFGQMLKMTVVEDDTASLSDFMRNMTDVWGVLEAGLKDTSQLAPLADAVQKSVDDVLKDEETSEVIDG